MDGPGSRRLKACDVQICVSGGSVDGHLSGVGRGEAGGGESREVETAARV